MTERLDRIEAAIERNTAGIDDLLGACAKNEAKIAEMSMATDARINQLLTAISENQQRFEVLRAEAQNDRAESRRNTDMLTANVQRLEQSIAKLSDNVALMVEENRSQRETVNNLIRLCTALVEKKAS